MRQRHGHTFPIFIFIELMMEHGPINGADGELQIVIYDIRSDGNISTLGEIFFVIVSEAVDVNLTLNIRGQEDPVTILVTCISHSF